VHDELASIGGGWQWHPLPLNRPIVAQQLAATVATTTLVWLITINQIVRHAESSKQTRGALSPAILSLRSATLSQL
jgi:hypothetical protein